MAHSNYSHYSALDENETVVTASSTVVRRLIAYNPSASNAAYVKLYAAGSGVDASSDAPAISIGVPTDTSIDVELDALFSSGCTVICSALAGTSAAAPNAACVVTITRS